jgi:hypothetical protein
MEEYATENRAIFGLCRQLANAYLNFSNVNDLPSGRNAKEE